MNVLLVTGGAGFIGSNFIKFFLETYKDFILINIDKLTYAGNLNNLKEVGEHPGYYFVKGDICDKELVNRVLNEYNPQYIVNFAAESHVDNSIIGPWIFGETNMMGTLNLLECTRKFWSGNSSDNKRFLQISTDEVYGSIDNFKDYFSEDSSLLPNSPYSASKAGADLMVRAFSKTFGFPAIVTRCCNNYGPYQNKEKFIPTCITKAIKDEPIPIYGDGSNTREWIHVIDHSSAIIKALFDGTPGEIYNIGSGEEISNIDMARFILRSLGKSEEAVIRISDRPGHDKRYALDSTKIKNELKWSCNYCLNEGILETIKWYTDDQSWWDN
ncbi:MAG: dTDP-glucose 4,6-dehydratase [Bacillota bacterium]